MKPALLRLVLRHANCLPKPTRARFGSPFGSLGGWLGAGWGFHHVPLRLRVLELFLQHAVFEGAWHGREGGVGLGHGVAAGKRPSAALGRRSGIDASGDVA